MPEETQAETFVRMLSEAWTEDREWKECHRRLRLEADVKRFVKKFRAETGRGRIADVPLKTGTWQGEMSQRPDAAE